MLVSVVIPAFRAEKTIGRAVRSVLAQHYESWEIVVVCDDNINYGEIIANAGLNIDRLRITSTGKVGSGEASARNAALDAARGDLIAPLDADDAFRPERLRELVPIAGAMGAATDNTAVHYEDDVAKVPFPSACKPFKLRAPDILYHRIPLFPVFLRELAGSGWPPVPFASDVIFNLELLNRSTGYICSDLSLYNYFKTPGSITNSIETWKVAEGGYVRILQMLAAGDLDLSHEIRAAAVAEFRENLVLNRLFREFFNAGLYNSLDDFLDACANGRAGWVHPHLERLKENDLDLQRIQKALNI